MNALVLLLAQCSADTGPIPPPVPPAPTPMGPASWWELGDSITYGEGQTPVEGYRYPLYNWTVANSYIVTFVGTASTGFWPDPLHDGHPGATIQDTSNTVAANWGTHVPDANLVILLIGTNNTSDPAYNGPAAAAAYASLLNQIALGHAATNIMVSTIPPRPPTFYPLQGNDFNARLPAIWDAFDATRSASTKLLRADFYTVLLPYGPTNFVAGDVHPSAVGYGLIAAEIERVVMLKWTP